MNMNLHNSMKAFHIFTKLTGFGSYKFGRKRKEYIFDPYSFIFSTFIIFMSIFLTIVSKRVYNAEQENVIAFAYSHNYMINKDCMCVVASIIFFNLKITKFANVLNDLEEIDGQLMKLKTYYIDYLQIKKLTWLGLIIYIVDYFLRFTLEHFIFFNGESKTWFHINCFLEDLAILKFCIIMYVPLNRLRILNSFFKRYSEGVVKPKGKRSLNLQ